MAMKRWLVLVASLLSTACADDHEAAACGGARPSLDECTRGMFFAECGGDAEPRFACSDVGCLWFTGGCIASEYVASECPTTNPCCVSRASGTWPYSSWEPDRARAGDVIEDVLALGGTAMGASSPGTRVQIDPTFSDDARGVRCGVGTDLQICNGAPSFPVGWVSYGGAIATELRNQDEAPEAVRIEIVPQSDGTLIARAIIRSFRDTPLPSSLPIACESGLTPDKEIRIDAASLTSDDLTRLDELHGHVVMAAGSGQVELVF